MLLIPIGRSFGSSDSHERYDYYVYYCRENETFYTRGAWGSNLLNPIFLPEVSPMHSWSSNLKEIRITLREVYQYMFNTTSPWKWVATPPSALAKPIECETCETEDNPKNKALKVVKEVDMEPGMEIEIEDKSDYVTCDCCGQLVPPHLVNYDCHGQCACNECYESVNICEDCGGFIFDGVGNNVNLRGRYSTFEGIVCDECFADHYVRCYDCGEYYPNDFIEYDDDELQICQNCAEDWVRCYECGTILRRDNAEYDDDNGEYYCDECIGSRRYRIRGYSYKPSPIFHHEIGMTYDTSTMLEPLYMGVELEIDNGRDETSCVRDVLEGNEELLYIKRDGSLNNGMELVSHPCTLAYHASCFPWAEIMSSAKDYGYRSHDTSTCGLHVHVNRYSLGITADQREATIAKIALLMERFWDTLVKFSRRDYSQLRWCKKMDLEICPGEEEHEKELVKKIANGRTRYHDDRYYALNLTNTNTVEFRLFRGTLKFDTFIATLQLVQNMVNWARVHSVKDTLKCSWDDFTKYEEYAELNAYMQERGITNTVGTKVTEAPVAKFNEGQTVFIRPDLEEWVEMNDIDGYIRQMYAYSGKQYVIEQVIRDHERTFGGDYIYRICGFSWGEDALIAVDDE